MRTASAELTTTLTSVSPLLPEPLALPKGLLAQIRLLARVAQDALEANQQNLLQRQTQINSLKEALASQRLEEPLDLAADLQSLYTCLKE